MYFQDEVFKGKNFLIDPLGDEYENCQFIGCSFAQAELSNISFQECIFQDCDLSAVKVGYTSFREVSFRNCKIMGVHFSDCNPMLLELSFENCLLNMSSFFQLSLKSQIFKDCELQEVDFTEVDLTEAKFLNCSLLNAVFERTNLQQTDFRLASHFRINPEMNQIKGARFTREGLEGLVAHLDIRIE